MSGAVEKLSLIEGLNVCAAVKAMGGKEDAYLRVLKLTARRLPETLDKLDGYIDDNNERGYLIDIHGIKSVLNGIGAFGLGSQAHELEDAAKSEDSSFRDMNYPVFRKRAAALARRIDEIFAGEAGAKTVASQADLKEALHRALAAARDYDNQLAAGLLAPFEDGGEISAVIRLLEAFEYKSAEDGIARLERGIT